MNRRWDVIEVTIANGANVSNTFSMLDWAGATLYMPASWTAAGIGFKVAMLPGDTFQNFYDHNDALVEIAAATAGRTYELPPELYATAYLQLWSQTAGSNVNQGADRLLKLLVKA